MTRSSPAPAIQLVTFGCRLNLVESEAMRRAAAQAGRDNLVIVNTCAVTAEATRQARQAIRRLARENPGAEIVVTGCAAQIDPLRFAEMPEVARVIGNARKTDPETWAEPWADPSSKGDFGRAMQAVTSPLAPQEGVEDHTRAFLAVQTGCDHRCTFCVIPYGRGPSRSSKPEAILAAVRGLTDKGFREIVLTGVDLTSYRRGSRRRFQVGRPRQGHPSRRSRPRTAAALLDRLHRGRRRSDRRLRHGAASRRRICICRFRPATT